MEALAIGIIPVVAGYLGWLTTRIIKIIETQATTVAKLEAVTVELSHQDQRIDTLVSSRFGA